MALINRFVAFFARHSFIVGGFFAFAFFTFFSCQKQKAVGTSAAFRQLPDSLFDGKMAPAAFFEAVRGLPTSNDLDSAFVRLFAAEPFAQDMDLFVRHLDFYEKGPQVSDRTRAWIDLQRGIVFDIQGHPDSARIFYEKGQVRARAYPDSTILSGALTGLADLDMQQNRPISAANRLAEALGIQRAVRDSVSILDISRSLAQCHIIQKAWPKAEAVAREGLTFSNPKAAPSTMSSVESALTVALLEQKKLDEAAILIQKNLARTASEAMLLYRGGWLMYFSRMRLAQQKPLEALDSLRAAERLPAEIAGIPIAANLREMLFSEAFAAIGQKKEAIARAEKALKLAEMIQNLPKRVQAEGTLANLLEADGQSAAAFRHLKNHRALADSIYQASQKGHFQDLLEQENADAHKRQVIALAAARDQEQQRKWFVGAFGLFAALGIAFFSRMRRKNERQKTEKERALRVAEAEIAAQKLLEAEALAASQREQLEDFARFVVEKNKQIETLRTQLEAAPTDSEPQERPAESEDVEALYRQSILTEADWERFKTYFERVYPGFLARLWHRWHDLTAGETRLILLIKMGMASRDMAAMLGVSAETIKKTRYRLRKKLARAGEKLEETIEAV